MHWSFISIVVSYVLGFLCTLGRILLTFGPAGGLGKYDWANPRSAMEVKMDPGRKALIGRLNAAQANTWETVPILCAGVFAAHLSNFDLATLEYMCQIYTVLRFGFIFAYVSGNTALSFVRTLCYAVNFWMMIYLIGYAAFNYQRA